MHNRDLIPDNIRQLIVAITELIDNGKTNDAILYCTKKIKEKASYAYLLRAQIYLNQYQKEFIESAIEDLNNFSKKYNQVPFDASISYLFHHYSARAHHDRGYTKDTQTAESRMLAIQDYEIAIEHCHIIKKIHEEKQSPHALNLAMLAELYYANGKIYSQDNRIEQAIDCYTKAKNVFNEIIDENNLNQSYQNIYSDFFCNFRILLPSQKLSYSFVTNFFALNQPYTAFLEIVSARGNAYFQNKDWLFAINDYNDVFAIWENSKKISYRPNIDHDPHRYLEIINKAKLNRLKAHIQLGRLDKNKKILDDYLSYRHKENISNALFEEHLGDRFYSENKLNEAIQCYKKAKSILGSQSSNELNHKYAEIFITRATSSFKTISTINDYEKVNEFLESYNAKIKSPASSSLLTTHDLWIAKICHHKVCELLTIMENLLTEYSHVNLSGEFGPILIKAIHDYTINVIPICASHAKYYKTLADMYYLTELFYANPKSSVRSHYSKFAFVNYIEALEHDPKSLDKHKHFLTFFGSLNWSDFSNYIQEFHVTKQIFLLTNCLDDNEILNNVIKNRDLADKLWFKYKIQECLRSLNPENKSYQGYFSLTKLEQSYNQLSEEYEKNENTVFQNTTFDFLL